MSKKDLGTVILKLQNCKAHDTILKNLSELSSNRPYDQIVVFNTYSEILDNHSVPILHLSQAKFFHGNILALDLASLYLSTKFVNVSNIYFYGSFVPWVDQIKSYSYWSNLFNNPKIQIIAKDQFLYDIYSIVWKNPILIAEDLKYETIKDII